MIDTHCHLTHAKFADDADAVIARAASVGVTACVTIGTGVDDGIRARALARRHAGYVFATAGLDPFSSHAAGAAFDEAFEALTGLFVEGGFHAVGEIGLDYHYDLDPRAVQAERFERQLELASRLDLPVVIHAREAHDDMAVTLKAHPRNRGVIHSFTGGLADADRYLAIGWYLAFNGAVTFKGADEVREAARCAPLDRILVETDSPYLAPIPKRGARCEPAFVRHTLAALAAVRGVATEVVEAATTANAYALFGIGR
jgi:TatD DNase family protein